jgi:hypothetical protein
MTACVVKDGPPTVAREPAESGVGPRRRSSRGGVTPMSAFRHRAVVDADEGPVKHGPGLHQPRWREMAKEPPSPWSQIINWLVTDPRPQAVSQLRAKQPAVLPAIDTVGKLAEIVPRNLKAMYDCSGNLMNRLCEIYRIPRPGLCWDALQSHDLEDLKARYEDLHPDVKLEVVATNSSPPPAVVRPTNFRHRRAHERLGGARQAGGHLAAAAGDSGGGRPDSVSRQEATPPGPPPLPLDPRRRSVTQDVMGRRSRI